MNAYPTFPASQADLAVGFLYRIVAFLAQCGNASGLGTVQARMLQTRARIVVFGARLLIWAGNFARLEMPRAQRVVAGVGGGATLSRHSLLDGGVRASRVGRQVRGGDGERQAGDADDGIVAGDARGRVADVRVWRVLPETSLSTTDAGAL